MSHHLNRPTPFSQCTRREILSVFSASALSTSLALGCARSEEREADQRHSERQEAKTSSLRTKRDPNSRAAIVQSLSESIVQEDLADIRSKSARLVQNLERASTAARGTDWAPVRTSFRQALLAWERATCFPSEALKKSHALLRAMFWPIRVGTIQTLFDEHAPREDVSVEHLGVDQKGLFALEFLLFGAPGEGDPPPVEVSGPRGSIARSLGLAYANDVLACAEKARDAHPHPSAEAISNTNLRLVRILGQMSSTLGSISNGKLSTVFDVDRDRRPAQVRGYASETSFAVIETRVAGTERAYRGPPSGGLSTLVARSAPKADEHLRASFGAALQAVERAAGHSSDLSALLAARETVRMLDVAIETELASALGVSLLFNANDAD